MEHLGNIFMLFNYYLFIYLSILLSIYIYISHYLSIYLTIYLSIYLSIYLFRNDENGVVDCIAKDASPIEADQLFGTGFTRVPGRKYAL